MQHHQPPTLAQQTLRRLSGWLRMLGSAIASMGPEAMIPQSERRTLRRELRLLEAVARRLAWMMAGTVTLPPVKDFGDGAPDPLAGAKRLTSAETGPARRSVDRRPLIPLTEAPPALPPEWGGPERMPINTLHTWRVHPSEDDALVPAGALANRFAALKAFADDPEPMARRMALWFRHKRAEAARVQTLPARERRYRYRLLPAPVRLGPVLTGLPQLEDVLWLLHDTVHNRGSPPGG
ncbi:MAG: hypothetical protein AAGJ32_02105 [Pseudomonadota bacterium]